MLPFTNLSIDPENVYFADGLTEELIADLSTVQLLRVTSRTSSMVFKDSRKDVNTIARELGVEYILQGSVRRAGEQLRISAQLIDASRDDHVWAEHFDGTVEDVFAIQERLARVIVAALELRLTDDEQRRLADRPIHDLHAYECYLRARYESWRWRRDARRKAPPAKPPAKASPPPAAATAVVEAPPPKANLPAAVPRRSPVFPGDNPLGRP